MSVPSNQRKPNTMAYVKKGSDLYLLTREVFSCIQNTYGEIYKQMLALANEYFVLASLADSYYLHEYSTKTQFRKREELLQDANSKLLAYRHELNLLWFNVKQGDNRFGKKEEAAKKFKRVSDVVVETGNLLGGIIKSDNERWDTWHPKKSKKK